MSCSTHQTETTPAQKLLSRLKSVQGKGILFGHQDDLAYGRNWRNVDGESDVKRVAGDYPAVFGWELGGLERGDSLNLDDVAFSDMKRLVIKAHQMGGINTFSWHPYSVVNGGNSWNRDTITVPHIIPGGSHHQQFLQQLDRIVAFFDDLKIEDGSRIPVIFRPWHEMGGSWFWWGQSYCSAEEYKALFRFTIQYLCQVKGLDNLVIAYSPNGGYSDAEGYLKYYPGDDRVDILGVDEYEWPGSEQWVEKMQHSLAILVDVAEKRSKLAVLAETGCENLPDSSWFTQRLNKAIEPATIRSKLSYVLIWRNDPHNHHFFAFEGHPAAMDARAFLDLPDIWLLNDLNSAKQKR